MGLKFLIPSGYESAAILLKQTLVFVMLLILAFCFYKAVHVITVFLAVAFMAVSEISFFLAYMVIQSGSRVFDFLSWCFGKGYFYRADAYVRVIKLTAYGLQVLMCVVFILLLYVSLRKIINSYKEKDYAMHRTELLFILIPGLAGWLICLLLRMIMVTVENGQMKQLAAGKGERENTELQAYLSEPHQTMDRLEFRFKTGNSVVDTLLVQSYDIGIILGNALDNAIGASRKLKGKEPDAETFIRLSSFQKGKMIFIEITNSFDGNGRLNFRQRIRQIRKRMASALPMSKVRRKNIMAAWTGR